MKRLRPTQIQPSLSSKIYLDANSQLVPGNRPQKIGNRQQKVKQWHFPNQATINSTSSSPPANQSQILAANVIRGRQLLANIESLLPYYKSRTQDTIQSPDPRKTLFVSRSLEQKEKRSTGKLTFQGQLHQSLIDDFKGLQIPVRKNPQSIKSKHKNEQKNQGVTLVLKDLKGMNETKSIHRKILRRRKSIEIGAKLAGTKHEALKAGNTFIQMQPKSKTPNSQSSFLAAQHLYSQDHKSSYKKIYNTLNSAFESRSRSQSNFLQDQSRSGKQNKTSEKLNQVPIKFDLNKPKLFSNMNAIKDPQKWQLVNILSFPKNKDYGKHFKSFQRSGNGQNSFDNFNQSSKHKKNLRSIGSMNLTENHTNPQTSHAFKFLDKEIEKSRLRQNSRGYESQVNRTYDTLNGYIYQKKRELITSSVDDVGFKTGNKKSRKGSIVGHPNRERSLSNKPSIPSLNMDKVREWVAKCEAYERKKQLEEDLKIQQNKNKNDPNNEGSSTQTPRADPSAVAQKLKKKSFKDAEGKSSLLNNHQVHKFPDSSQSSRDDGYKDYNHIYEDSSTENAKEYEEAGIFLQ